MQTKSNRTDSRSRNLFLLAFCFIVLSLSGCRTATFSSVTEGNKSLEVRTVNGSKYDKACALLTVDDNSKMVINSKIKSGLIRVRVMTNTANYELLSADIVKSLTFGSEKEHAWQFDPGDYYVCFTPERKPTGTISAEIREK